MRILRILRISFPEKCKQKNALAKMAKLPILSILPLQILKFSIQIAILRSYYIFAFSSSCKRFRSARLRLRVV